MSPTLLRKVWTTIDCSATSALMRLSDGEMAQALAERMAGDYGLSPEECLQIKAYVSEKASLIRDVALR